MTQSGYEIVNWFFTTFWSFFNSWHIPGTGMTPASFFFLCLFVPLSLKVVTSLINGTSISSAPIKSIINRTKTSKE